MINIPKNSDYLHSAVNTNHRTELPTFISSQSGIVFSNDLLSNQQWVIINATQIMDHISFVCESKVYDLKKGVKLLIQKNNRGCQREAIYLMEHCAQIVNNYSKCRSENDLSF